MYSLGATENSSEMKHPEDQANISSIEIDMKVTYEVPQKTIVSAPSLCEVALKRSGFVANIINNTERPFKRSVSVTSDGKHYV